MFETIPPSSIRSVRGLELGNVVALALNKMVHFPEKNMETRATIAESKPQIRVSMWSEGGTGTMTEPCAKLFFWRCWSMFLVTALRV